MITSGSHSRPTTLSATIQFLVRTKWVLGLAIAALLAVAATPPQQVSDEDTDQQYIHIMNLVDRADALRASGKADAAKAKDLEAYKALIMFQKMHPRWYQKTVEYRLNELNQEIEGKPAEMETPEEPAPAPKPHTNLEAPAKSVTASKSSAKLIDPGSEPRKVLRLHVKPGDKQTMIMTLKMDVSMDMPGAPAGAANAIPKLPGISIPADVTIQSVAPNGDITYEMAFEEPGIADEPGTQRQVVQAMKTALSGLKGLTVTGVLSDRGVNKKVDIKEGANVNPQARQTLDQMKDSMINMGSPLPDEPVGAGAKWEVKMPVKSQGMNVDQTTDYQLVSATGDRVSTTFTQSQSAANQKLQSASMGGAQVSVLQMTNSASGNVTSDLSKLMPLQATIDSHMEMNSEIKANGKSQPMAMKTGIKLSIESQ